MSFKDTSFLELWWPFCSAKWNHLCNFGRGYQEEEFCEILNLDQWFRCHLKDFLSGALAAIVFGGAEPYMQFCRGQYGELTYEVILNLDAWFRKCCLKKKFTDGQRPITIAHLEPSAHGS